VDNSKQSLNLNDYGYSKPSRLRAVSLFVWELAKVAIISSAIIIPVRYFLIQPFYVKGASMEPNFYDHEYLIVDELSYRLGEPNRGDIVVFKYPRDPRQYFIKRVIGLPGERVMIGDGQITIVNKNGTTTLEETYLPAELLTELPAKGYGDVTLAIDEYFLLGDNRNQSLDSRVFGPVKKDFIVGRTWIRGWPFDRLTVFSAPQYGTTTNK